MMLIGDIGGFNGAIIVPPTIIMSFYNSFMYRRAILAEIPVNRNSKRKKKIRQWRFLNKVKAFTEEEPL